MKKGRASADYLKRVDTLWNSYHKKEESPVKLRPQCVDTSACSTGLCRLNSSGEAHASNLIIEGLTLLVLNINDYRGAYRVMNLNLL
jgi:hypothetical protein